MPSLPDAQRPVNPFPVPIPVLAANPTDAPMVCISVNIDWVPYIVGACRALLAQSTWDSDDENVVHAQIKNVHTLLELLNQYEACPMPVEFRINPLDGRYWDYSNDAGTTWTRQPDTVQKDLVVKDPSAAGANDIQGGDGFAGLIMQGLNFAAMILKSNDTGLTVTKDASQAAIDSAPLVQLIGNDSYDYPLLEAGPS